MTLQRTWLGSQSTRSALAPAAPPLAPPASPPLARARRRRRSSRQRFRSRLLARRRCRRRLASPRLLALRIHLAPSRQCFFHNQARG